MAIHIKRSSTPYPITPILPITKESARQRDSYVVATCDEAGRLAEQIRFQNGKREFAHRYQYWSNGVLRSIAVDYNETGMWKTTHEFNENGERIRNEKD